MISYDELRFLRLEKGLSQKEVARQVNIATNTLSDYENGKVMPNIDIFQKILHVLGYQMNVYKNEEPINEDVDLINWYKKPVYKTKHDMMIKHGVCLSHQEDGKPNWAYIDFMKKEIKKQKVATFFTGHFISYKGQSFNFFQNGFFTKKGIVCIRLYFGKKKIVGIKKALFHQQKLIDVTEEWATLEEVTNHFYEYIKYANETEVHLAYREDDLSSERLTKEGETLFKMDDDLYQNHLYGFAQEKKDLT